jgi:Uma2 family endonuclease
MTIVETLLTAEEYALLPDNGQPTELIRGRLVTMNMPSPRHGYFCNKIGRLLGDFVDAHDLGRVMSNDSGVVTRRDPDTVRGADVAFYSYHRLPKGPLPEGYAPVAPELVFEVRSVTDRWRDVLAKVAEYLNAGVLVVGVLDPQTETLHLYHADQPPQDLTREEELVLQDLLPGFQVPISRFLE